jgi:methionyl-tRNA synthetase
LFTYSIGILFAYSKTLWVLFCFLALKVFKQLNLSAETHLSLSDDKGDLDRVKRPWDILSAGHKIGTPKALLRELVSGLLFEISKEISSLLLGC